MNKSSGSSSNPGEDIQAVLWSVILAPPLCRLKQARQTHSRGGSKGLQALKRVGDV